MLGKEATEEMWVAAVDAPGSTTVKAASGGTDYTTRFTLTPAGEGTQLRLSFGAEAQNPGWKHRLAMALFGKLGMHAARKAINQDLYDIAAAAEARRAADGSPPHVVSLRGGCLMDDAADAASRWRYAPVDGSALLRPLERAHRVANRESGVVEQEHGAVPLAGYSFAPALLDGLRAAKPTAPERCRTVAPERPGLPLWRRAEPGTDPELSERLAADIAEWISSCAS